LVELDPELAGQARAAAEKAGLPNVEVVDGDAAMTSVYEALVPAHVLMVCGVFGNITDDDVWATVFELPYLSAAGATVIWTRHRGAPDLTPTIRAWFGDAGFEELGFDTDSGTAFGVGTNRLTGVPLEFRGHRRMFTFVGDGTGARL
jgi:hypothetical protein